MSTSHPWRPHAHDRFIHDPGQTRRLSTMFFFRLSSTSPPFTILGTFPPTVVVIVALPPNVTPMSLPQIVSVIPLLTLLTLTFFPAYLISPFFTIVSSPILLPTLPPRVRTPIPLPKLPSMSCTAGPRFPHQRRRLLSPPRAASHSPAILSDASPSRRPSYAPPEGALFLVGVLPPLSALA